MIQLVYVTSTMATTSINDDTHSTYLTINSRSSLTPWRSKWRFQTSIESLSTRTRTWTPLPTNVSVNDSRHIRKATQQIFMAFIVDLTHIMETLFILTARGHNKLTRRAIKVAYSIYHDSNVMIRAHAHIQTYRNLDGRDAALEMIESLIRPERSVDSNVKDYYAEISKLDILGTNLDREEEW